jgi:hypothetical protein
LMKWLRVNIDMGEYIAVKERLEVRNE